MQTHSEERSHNCPECDKSFKSKYIMNLHIKLHSDEKSTFVCSVQKGSSNQDPCINI